ncbi:hypothetical protein Pfo_029008 [Paulownia fortunei]|nr:hypothetical protein Pfo_029008 [Paulownia fortunei]
MAAFNLSYPTHSPSSPRIFSQISPSRNTLALSFYSLPNPALLFPSTSLKRSSPLKYRRLSLVVSVLKKLSETDLVARRPSIRCITRNIAASVLAHKKSVPELCCSVKVAVVEEPDKTALTEAWKSWMQEHIAATGKVPPGNEPGNTTWVKKAPGKKSDLRLTPGRHVQLTVPLEDLIDRLVKENKVVAFIKGSRSAPLCGFSQRVVAILESQGVEYESVDILDEEYNYGLRETFFVNGELVGGCDILTSMFEKGELAGLLK